MFFVNKNAQVVPASDSPHTKDLSSMAVRRGCVWFGLTDDGHPRNKRICNTIRYLLYYKTVECGLCTWSGDIYREVSKGRKWISNKSRSIEAARRNGKPGSGQLGSDSARIKQTTSHVEEVQSTQAITIG